MWYPTWYLFRIVLQTPVTSIIVTRNGTITSLRILIRAQNIVQWRVVVVRNERKSKSYAAESDQANKGELQILNQNEHVLKARIETSELLTTHAVDKESNDE